MLGIGQKFPTFSMDACVSLEKGKEFKNVSNADMKGAWSVFFFWPLDFTFVCPTEIVDFNSKAEEFSKLNCQVVGCSIDSHFSHREFALKPREQGVVGYS